MPQLVALMGKPSNIAGSFQAGQRHARQGQAHEANMQTNQLNQQVTRANLVAAEDKAQRTNMLRRDAAALVGGGQDARDNIVRIHGPAGFDVLKKSDELAAGILSQKKGVREQRIKQIGDISRALGADVTAENYGGRRQSMIDAGLVEHDDLPITFDPKQVATYHRTAAKVATKITPYTDEAKSKSDLDNNLITPKQHAANIKVPTGGVRILTPEEAQEALGGNYDSNVLYQYDKTGLIKVSGKTAFDKHKTFRGEVKPILDKATKLRRSVNNVYAGLKSRNGVGDIAAINAYQRLIDDAVVRGEDVELIQSAASTTNRLKAWVKNKKEGDVLDDNLRRHMADMARDLYASGSATHISRIDGFRSIVESIPGLKWGRVVPDATSDMLSSPLPYPKYLRGKAAIKNPQTTDYPKLTTEELQAIEQGVKPK